MWLALAVLAPRAQAETVKVDGGMAFFHGDWEVACDNTRTCRIAGYQQVEFSTGDVGWHLSDDGAAAVLLKVDDYQRRVGTRGALARKGTRDETDVARALPVPVVHQASVVERTMSADALPAAVDLPALRKALAAAISSDDCDLSPQENGDPIPLQAARLDAHHLLVSAVCWRAAYNSGVGFWVLDDRSPHQPVLVSTIGSDYEDGRITSSMKGRGLGDCWSMEEWAWDGRQFVHTASSTSGMCKLLAPGGAWSLPTIVTKVR